jgi:translation initiation factor IF-2
MVELGESIHAKQQLLEQLQRSQHQYEAMRAYYEGKLRTLKSFKDNVQTVAEGNECGINFFGWEDMQAGDVIECYTLP